MLACILFLALISIMATTAHIMSLNDLFISRNYQYEHKAFHNAEAGIHLGLKKLEASLENGLQLPDQGTMTIPGAVAPKRFSFEVSDLSVLGNNLYKFVSTGRAAGNAQSRIRINLKRKPAFTVGIFGNATIACQSHSQYYSYDSRLTENPSPTDATGQCHLAANRKIELAANTLINGNIYMGKFNHADAECRASGTCIITGEQIKKAMHIREDPLCVNNAVFQPAFDVAMAANDNFDIVPALAGVDIENPGGDIQLAGKAGGSTFYFEKIMLNTGDSLTLDARDGPIAVYLRGRLTAQGQARINLIDTSADHGITIYITENSLDELDSDETLFFLHSDVGFGQNCAPSDVALLSDSDAIFEFQNQSDVAGLFYVPNGTLKMKNQGRVLGVVWGRRVEIQAGAVFYFDTALTDRYLSAELAMTSWETF